MSHNLPRRIAVAAVAIPAIFGIVYLGGWALTATLALVAVLGAGEFYALAARSGIAAFGRVGRLGAALAPVAVFAMTPSGPGVAAAWIVTAGLVWVFTVMLAALRRGPEQHPMAAVAVTVFGVLYAGVLPAFLIPLRHATGAPTPLAATWLVFLPLILTWVCDTAAMAAGLTIRGPKVAPVVSPNKTWSGSIAGVGSALVLAPLYGVFVLQPLGVHLHNVVLLGLSLVAGVGGQLGDVAESLFKREARVKDSGTILPGHGGILDRLDSLYWVLPLSTMLLLLGAAR